MCMLLCEKNLDISRSVAKALRSYGIGDIQIAEDADAATRLIGDHDVAVAVVDLAGLDSHNASLLVRSLSARGAEVILYSDRRPEPAEFADLHYIFVDKSVHVDDLAHLAAAQRRLALGQQKA